MKNSILFLFLAPLAAAAADAEPAVGLEPVDHDPAWRVSAGFRAAPGIKTSAAVDAGAAAAAAGAVPRPAGKLGSSSSGTTAADARAGSGFSGGGTRLDFDNGWIDLDDGAGIAGETQNWHFDDASAFEDGAIRTRRPYSATKTGRTRTVEWSSPDAGLRGSSDEAAWGAELRIDRTLWENADFGIDAGLGFAWFADVDCFSLRGRTGFRETETETVSTESGAVVASIRQDEFSDLDDIRNADGSIGGGYVVGGKIPDGYKTPVLTVDEDRFSFETERNSSSRKTRTTSVSRAVDVRSEGTLSLQELRIGVRPFWKAARRLSLRGDVGLLAIRSELETDTRLSADGVPVAAIRKDDDDWTLGGYAGAALDLAATDALTFSLGAEARFPHKKLRFDDGVVSGKVGLAEWSAFASVGWRF